ncbi:hypothetical protein Scel_23810 [Streptomyces cellostaticus]|nr:hypothetical protein Scel_23810 [Streptomyces cellostaticus]
MPVTNPTMSRMMPRAIMVRLLLREWFFLPGAPKWDIFSFAVRKPSMRFGRAVALGASQG